MELAHVWTVRNSKAARAVSTSTAPRPSKPGGLRE